MHTARPPSASRAIALLLLPLVIGIASCGHRPFVADTVFDSIHARDLQSFRIHLDSYADKELQTGWTEIASPDHGEFLDYALVHGFRVHAGAAAGSWYTAAIGYDNPDAIRKLVRVGTDVGLAGPPYSICPYGNFVIRCALEKPNLELFTAFFQAGVMPSLTYDGKPILLDAIQLDNLAAAQFLLDLGAAASETYEGRTMLEYARSAPMATLLKDHGG